MRQRVTLIAAAIVLLLAGGLFWQLRGTRGDHASSPRTAAVPASPSSASPSVPAQPTTPAATPGSAAPVELDPDGNPRPQPVPLDPSAHPPSADTPHSKPASPQQPFTREETITKREADLKLLDETKTRLESDLATARKSGDSTAVHDLEVRIKRTTELRTKRATELDEIRAGGTVPQ